MTAESEQWEAAVADLWGRFDSFDREGGVAAMQALADRCPAEDGRAAFELAGMYDSMGFETEAGTEYERALELGLNHDRHAQLAVQYGSTLRNLGRLDEAIAVLQAAPMHATTGSAPRVGLSLALHRAGRKDEALRVAIEAQIDALPRYQRSMHNYAAALTESATSDESANVDAELRRIPVRTAICLPPVPFAMHPIPQDLHGSPPFIRSQYPDSLSTSAARLSWGHAPAELVA